MHPILLMLTCANHLSDLRYAFSLSRWLVVAILGFRCRAERVGRGDFGEVTSAEATSAFGFWRVFRHKLLVNLPIIAIWLIGIHYSINGVE
jgi:hypothetical protein